MTCARHAAPSGQSGARNGNPDSAIRGAPRLDRGFELAPDAVPARVRLMFTVNEAEAEAIRRAYEAGGELAAVVELRRHFPEIADNENARLCMRTIVGWSPRPPQPQVRRRRIGSTKS